MSSKKDFISIDELFQGLENGEEDMPVGAWSKMEGILNNQMPLGGRVLSRNYKFLIPIISLFLLGGSVYLWNQKMELQKTTNNSFEKKNQEINILTPQIINQTADIKVENGNLFKQFPTLASNSKGFPKENKNRNATFLITNKNDHNNKNDQNKNQTHSKKNIPLNPLASSSHPSNKLSLPNNVKEVGLKQGLAITIEEGNSNSKPLIKTPIEVQEIIEVIKGDVIRKDIDENQQKSFAENFSPQTQYNNLKIVINKDGQLFKEEKNTYQRIEMQRTRMKTPVDQRPAFQLDTISIVRIQSLKYTPLNDLESYGVRKFILASTNYSAASSTDINSGSLAKETLVSLSNFKVKSKKVKPMDAIKNTAGGFANYFDGSHPFYVAMIIGGNSSLGNPSAYGMQLGFAALYSMGERWTLSTEFRFANKYFPQFSFLDQENTYQIQKEQTAEGWLYTGIENTIKSNYVVKNINILNLPIYLSYNFNDRLSVLGGVNFSYGLPLSWKKENSFSQANIHQIRDENQNPFKNSSFQINEKEDFTSRFGIGYVAGLNYELSRKFSLDGRVTQNIWSNGSKSLPELRNIYHNASIELSLGIYFGRKEKVVYIMDRGK